MQSSVLSVVIPLYNEADNVVPLLTSLTEALANTPHEIILVDDGSTDGTPDRVRAQAGDGVRLIELARNFGQTAALSAGIDFARGDYIATMDGDMQNDPADIVRMLQILIDQKLDMVTGWRKDRKDSWLLRCLPSVAANRLIRVAGGAPIHDSGCTLKVMTAAAARQIEWRGQMHRFIPVLCHMSGGRVVEVEVQHHPRRHGVSKYGFSRSLSVAADIMLLWFMRTYRDRPMHGFGSLGVLLLLADAVCLVVGWLAGYGGLALTLLCFLIFMLGMQFILMGILAELVLRFVPQKKNYVLKSTQT